MPLGDYLTLKIVLLTSEWCDNAGEMFADLGELFADVGKCIFLQVC